MVVHLVLGVRSTAIKDAEAVISEPSSLAPSSSIDQPSRPVGIEAVLNEVFKELAPAVSELRIMLLEEILLPRS